MKNLLAATLIIFSFFSCQKDHPTEFNQLPSCDCFTPLGFFAHWDYETTRDFYDENGMISDKKQRWTTAVENVVDEMSEHFEDGHRYHIRKIGSDVDNLYNVRYLRQSDQNYVTPYKTFLKDAPIGAEWEVDVNKRRVVADRIASMQLAGQRFKDVIVVEEIKTYNNGEEYILFREHYAKNVGLIQSTSYNYDNNLISSDTKTLINYYSDLNI